MLNQSTKTPPMLPSKKAALKKGVFHSAGRKLGPPNSSALALCLSWLTLEGEQTSTFKQLSEEIQLDRTKQNVKCFETAMLCPGRGSFPGCEGHRQAERFEALPPPSAGGIPRACGAGGGGSHLEKGLQTRRTKKGTNQTEVFSVEVFKTGFGFSGENCSRSSSSAACGEKTPLNRSIVNMMTKKQTNKEYSKISKR